MALVGSPFSPWPSCRCWWCRWWCSRHRGSRLLFGTWRFSSTLLAPEMEPQGTLRTSVLSGTHGSPTQSCWKLCLVARGLPRAATHKDCLPIFSADAARRLGHSREPGRPEEHGSWTCTRSSLHLPPEGLRRASPCSAGCERSVRRLQAASLARGQRCGQGLETGEERQSHTQSPIQRGLSHPRRSGRPWHRAQTRSRTPFAPPTSQQSQPSRAEPLGHKPVPREH